MHAPPLPQAARRRPRWRAWRAGLVAGGALASATLLASGPALVLSPCELAGIEHPALCGTLARPLDPARPAGTSIELQVAVVPALARHKLPDPVVFLAGGPGQSAIELAATSQHLVGRLTQRRDLVLVDQRGTGGSAPLRCPGDDDPLQPLHALADVDAAARRLAACRAQLERLPHGDLRQYTTHIAALDLEAVRAALGAPQLNLFGVSYGTRLALEYLRIQPVRVRRAVLDGVAPPDLSLPASAAQDAAAAVDALLRWCAGDGACARRHPELRSQWQQLRAGLPRDAVVPHPMTGEPQRVRVDRATLDGLVRAALYQPARAAALPPALAEALRDRWGPLFGLAAAAGGGQGRRGGIASGQHYAVICSEDLRSGPAPAAPGGPASGPVDGQEASYRRLCADWPRGPVPAAFDQVPAAPAPVLLLSGGLDPVTPPRHAQRVADRLGALARHVVVPAAGHGVSLLPCLRDAVQRFIEAGDRAAAMQVDTGCAAGVPRPPLFVPPATGAAP